MRKSREVKKFMKKLRMVENNYTQKNRPNLEKAINKIFNSFNNSEKEEKLIQEIYSDWGNEEKKNNILLDIVSFWRETKKIPKIQDSILENLFLMR